MTSRAYLFFMAVILTACNKVPAEHASADSAVAGATKVPPTALRELRWLMGTWRGTGAEGTTQEPFYERYSLANDSTLLVESFKDSTRQLVTDTTRYELRGGTLSNPGPGPRWIASAVSRDSIFFTPLQTARNQFTWRKGDDTSWMAILVWPQPDSMVRRRVYLMARLQ